MNKEAIQPKVAHIRVHNNTYQPDTKFYPNHRLILTVTLLQNSMQW